MTNVSLHSAFVTSQSRLITMQLDRLWKHVAFVALRSPSRDHEVVWHCISVSGAKFLISPSQSAGEKSKSSFQLISECSVYVQRLHTQYKFCHHFLPPSRVLCEMKSSKLAELYQVETLLTGPLENKTTKSSGTGATFLISPEGKTSPVFSYSINWNIAVVAYSQRPTYGHTIQIL